MSKMSEVAEIRTVLAPAADRYNTNPATDVINMKYYDHVTFVLSEGAGGTGTVKIQVEKCTSKAGAGNTAIASKYRVATYTGAYGALTTLASTGYTTTAGANKQVLVEVDAADLGPSYPYVRLQLTEVVDNACTGSVVAICWKASYPQATPPISLS